MKLVDLLNKASAGYDDDFLSEYFDTDTGDLKEGHGDTLAEFIVVELTETFDSDGDDEDQMSEAVRVMERAKRDLEDVITALLKSWPIQGQ